MIQAFLVVCVFCLVVGLMIGRHIHCREHRLAVERSRRSRRFG